MCGCDPWGVRRPLASCLSWHASHPTILNTPSPTPLQAFGKLLELGVPEENFARAAAAASPKPDQ